MKVPSQLPEQAKDYFSVWQIVLSQWLHWSDDRIQTFIQRGLQYMADEDDLFYHELPFHYLNHLLMSAAMRQRFVGAERISIQSEVEGAFSNGDCFAFNQPNFDWGAARLRVGEVLARYGGAFPKPEDLAWYEEDHSA